MIGVDLDATTTALGAIGLLSMVALRLALKVADFDSLPDALAARVRWWERHHPAVLVLSACVLIVGLAGLAFG